MIWVFGVGLPVNGIRLDIFLNLPVGSFAADDMIVKAGLPAKTGDPVLAADRGD